MTYTTLKALSVAAFASLSAACGSFTNGPDQAITIQEAHPITVDSQVVTMTLAAGGGDGSLSDVDAARVRAFAASYIRNGHGPVTVTSPSSDATDRSLAANAREALNASGVPFTSIKGASYRTGRQTGDDVILSYTHYVATPSACGIWEGMRQRDYQNLRSPNFGCSQQNNLAAMIGDPRDLVVPATMEPGDAEFRIRGVEAFREGDITTTAADGILDEALSE